MVAAADRDDDPPRPASDPEAIAVRSAVALGDEPTTCASRGPVATPAPAVPAADAPATPRPGIPRPVAAFLGDSYTTGWAGAGIGAAGWPSLVSGPRGWRMVNRAVAGTGFVNPGWTGQPIRTQVAAVVKARPGIVFVAGGHNDRRFGAAATGRAAAEVLERLRRELPDAVIVVLGPIWQSGSPPQQIRGIRDRLRTLAQAVDALFIDPLRDGWFSGEARRLILSDGIHPSDRGHRRMADLVTAALGDDPRTSGSPPAPAQAPSPSPVPVTGQAAESGPPPCAR
jgi:lysophospholipase L1-like esterase